MNPGHRLAQSGQGNVSRALAQTLVHAMQAHTDVIAPLQRLLADPVAGVPLQALEPVLDAYRMHAGAACGLQWGACARPATFSALGYLAMSSRTLGEALGLMPVYESVVMDMGLTTLDHDAQRARLHWGLRHGAAHPVLEDFIVAAWLSLGRWLVGQAVSPLAVRLTHAAPDDARPYPAFFGCPVEFACTRAGLDFPVDWLALPLLHADPELHALMRERAAALQTAQRACGVFSGQVLALLPDLLPRQQATMAVVAQRLHLSERSLRRRLTDEGTGFQDLLRQQRQQLARHYVRDGRTGLLDVALLLGYSEHSAFTTAFRQWFGMTPREYRLAAHAGDTDKKARQRRALGETCASVHAACDV